MKLLTVYKYIFPDYMFIHKETILRVLTTNLTLKNIYISQMIYFSIHSLSHPSRSLLPKIFINMQPQQSKVFQPANTFSRQLMFRSALKSTSFIPLSIFIVYLQVDGFFLRTNQYTELIVYRRSSE